ncbi:MAG TPA: VOC family protein [Solirubrobacterales bacterium]|nr:VOC family protein [Solirubrobacterales bacterium]
MSERTSYVPGTPCWVDLATPDIEGAERFYGELFAWEIPELPDSAEMAGYRRAKKDGRDVAGVMPLMQEGQPSAWSTYISVDDADAIGRAVQENGGTMIAEPMAVSNYGRLALFTDPEGAFFGIWEPADFAGSELVNEKGAVGWNELESRDPEGAKRFYGAVFGWEFQDHDMGEMTYTEWQVDGKAIGGMADIEGRIPDEVPAHWMVYFGSVDTDEAVDKIKELGGQVHFGPVDIPAGRFAMVADPYGAGFAVMQPSEQTLARAREQGLI